ncbi:hypothetical protein D3C73_1100910 [compost metagenome]
MILPTSERYPPDYYITSPFPAGSAIRDIGSGDHILGSAAIPQIGAGHFLFREAAIAPFFFVCQPFRWSVPVRPLPAGTYRNFRSEPERIRWKGFSKD